MLCNILLLRHRVRPSFLLPFWHVGGLTLGFTSALIGGKVGAMACTVAVEGITFIACVGVVFEIYI